MTDDDESSITQSPAQEGTKVRVTLSAHDRDYLFTHGSLVVTDYEAGKDSVVEVVIDLPVSLDDVTALEDRME